MDYAKSVQPSQLVAERGADVVVINPGSANLRIGVASSPNPIVVPHLIARLLKPSPSHQTPERGGAVGEHLFRSEAATMGRMPETSRESSFQSVESSLRSRQSMRKRGQLGEPARNGAIKAKDFKWETKINSLFAMTKVRMDQGLGLLPVTNLSEQSHESDPPLLMGNGKDEGSQFRRYICGDEALRIPANEPYVLRRPICRGRLNVSDQYSIQQVCDDLHEIWEWVLSEKLSLPKKARQTMSALLVVPDTFDNREVKELFSVVLKDLQFRSAVVHQECVAATFGNGIPTACVVHLGAQVTSITCIEDGVVIPNSRLVYPYGGDDVARCLLWVEKQHQAWPVHDTDPLHNPLDMLMLNHLKEELCALIDGEQHVSTDICSFKPSKTIQVHKATLKALNVPPMGLFFPFLLAPEEYAPLQRPWYNIDHEDVLDEVNHEAGRKLEFAEAGALNGLNGSSTNGGTLPNSATKGPPSTSPLNVDRCVGLQQAIVSSIFTTGRQDIQAKLFSSIQLVGGVASTNGLVDAIEERVLQALPEHEAVDRVEVLPNRTDPSLICWKGGVVLCVLDFARDAWVQYEDWMEGGIRIGAARKYKDSNSIHAQTFWYNSALE